MTGFTRIYPGFQFIDRLTGDPIVIVEKIGGSYHCESNKSYEDENGLWIEVEPYEEVFTETEMKRMLITKHLIWSDKIE